MVTFEGLDKDLATTFMQSAVCIKTLQAPFIALVRHAKYHQGRCVQESDSLDGVLTASASRLTVTRAASHDPAKS